MRGTLKWDAQVDFIDKLASPEEVVMRLRRLMGTTPDTIRLGSKISIDTANETVYVHRDDNTTPISELHGLRFDILQELASTWYRSPRRACPIRKAHAIH